MRFIIAFAAMLGLAGCDTLNRLTEPDTNTTAGVITACAGISSALRVLTPLKADMTATQIASIDRVDGIARPICTAEDPPAPAYDLVQSLLADAIAVQTAVVEE